jgi:hypothetical protein
MWLTLEDQVPGGVRGRASGLKLTPLAPRPEAKKRPALSRALSVNPQEDDREASGGPARPAALIEHVRSRGGPFSRQACVQAGP